MTSLPDVSILLVDDAHAPHAELTQAVGQLGHSLRRAASAEAADMVASGDFALVLVMVDIADKIAPAVELVGAIKAATAHSPHGRSGAVRPPILVLAPNLSCDFPVSQAYEAGALDVLLAPLLAVELKAKIGFLLEVHGIAAERRRGDAALAATREQLEHTLFSAELATWSWDLQSGLVKADAAMARMFALPPGAGGEAPYTVYLDAVHPDDRHDVERSIRAAIDDGVPFDVEYRVRHADGNYRNVIARAHMAYDEDGEPATLRGVIIDVSRRTRAEDRARASEERYRILFESVDDGVCMIDVLFDANGTPYDYRFLEMNAAFVKHTGLENAVGKTVLELVPQHDTHWFTIYGKVARTGEPVRIVEEAKALSRWYDVYAARVGGPGSTRVAVLFTDISERIAAEDQLRRLAADLSEADRRKTEFLATLAHELRNPLAPIRSGLQVMRLAAGDPATMARVQDIMDRQLNHMVALVDDLLDVARITRAQVDLKRELVDVRDVLSGAIETVLHLIEAEQHVLSTDIPNVPLLLDADPTRIRQVVSNLLNNAAKYTPRGGHVGLAVRADGDSLLIEVRDNGIGIEPEALHAVFDMFTQVGRERHRTAGGLGIGLSLVRSLVELHGGTVAAASDGPGKGSVFTVRLPLALAPAAALADEAQARDAPGPAAGLRIMVVDDNCDAASTLAELLALTGHATAVANGGREALDAAPGFRPDVMFLDIGMPGMNGYELARALREDSRFNAVLLVALTGWGGEDDRNRTREAGFDKHLTKPVNLDAIEALLADYRAGAT